MKNDSLGGQMGNNFRFFGLFVGLFVGFGQIACAGIPLGTVYRGSDLSVISAEESVRQLDAGTVVFLGEVHYQKDSQGQQLEVLRAIQSKGFKVSVGMEFFNYTEQELLNRYLAGEISEENLLSQTSSWSNPKTYDFYRDQVLFGSASGGTCIGLNIPRSVTSKVSKGGMESLNPEDLKLLPPNFAVGNNLYKERFIEAVGGHMPPEKVNNYFLAQSMWDDTMAWKIVEYMNKNPDHILVVVVGGFHVKYGGGLPDRVRARGWNKQLLYYITDVKSENEEELRPSDKYGLAADYILPFESSFLNNLIER